MELALKLHPHRAGAYAEIKKLYRKVGAGGIKVFVRGQRPNFDVRPVIQNGRTLVPVRAISEALGAKVDYDPNNRKVFINNGSINIELTVDDDSAVVNGRNVKLDQAATVVNGRTLVPLRFVSENFGARVDWDGETQTVTVE
ncbi:MAG: copper amine oxidase N-terminal domain-containing protein [Peptococcaceae bacterium]|nr:copper amine oxidase N-terminal domain-containing protein [Peptococcaceae bacterium]